jgi:limonene-1,2-epoxide hydrolase
MNHAMNTSKLAVVEELLALIDAAHNTVDTTAIGERIFNDLLADDLDYQNHPQRRTRGKAEFATWQRELAAVESMRCEIIRAAVAGDWVLTERRDSWTINSIRLSTPLMGSFEVRDDSKIHAWIDYLPYAGAWERSGQMRPGFFTDWATQDLMVDHLATSDDHH